MLKSITCLFIAVLVITSFTHTQIPKPEEVFGFRIGSDYKLADYDQMLFFYEKLSAATDRVKMVEIGKSVMGRPIKMLFISSTQNLSQLEKYRQLNEKLARARIPEAEARQISLNGKAIVWIDGGMHATERAPAQMTNELAYRIAAEESPEMQKIREEVITLLVPVINPDGLDLVVDWYRQNLGTPYETSSPPVLYQRYVGHDNNRDWFMGNMPETRMANRVLYQQWFPQIVHNHHQTSPAWARIFLPPFRSPVNDRIHPGVTTGVNLVGTAMANRFAMKRMPGVISGVGYSMWWNGGMRTAPYYHNMIGILTETAHATPTPRFYDPARKPKTIRGLRTDGTEIFYPYPWEGGESHFREAVDYMLTASIAVLDIAADRKEEFLWNFYQMGRDAIESAEAAFAYIIPAEQWDSGEAYNLVRILRQGGLDCRQAVSGFTAGGESYSKGSFLFYGAQSFRPFLIDLLEKQAYPDQQAYPGGPLVRPYDLAGWTLPLQMGVRVDRVDESFEAVTEAVEGALKMPAGRLETGGVFLLSCRSNAAYQAVNLAQRMNVKVGILQENYTEDDRDFGPGDFVFSGDGIRDPLLDIAGLNGVEFTAQRSRRMLKQSPLERIKVGLYKSWVANMDEGWTRWVLEQHAFDLDTLHDADLHNDDLSTYHAIIIPDQSPQRILNGHRPGTMPKRFCGGIGAAGTLKLKEFVESGGTLVTFDRASDFAIDQFGLPVRNAVKNLSGQQFYIPGSLIRARVKTGTKLTYGVPEEVAVSFSRSRAFEVFVPSRTREGGKENIADADKPAVQEVVRYADEDILLSGWALGEERHLKDRAAMMEVKHGDGKVVLFAFRPQFRGQTRATYKLIFNAILAAASE